MFKYVLNFKTLVTNAISKDLISEHLATSKEILL